MTLIVFIIMHILAASGIQAFDALATRTSVIVIYALAFIVVLFWTLISISKSRGLINHYNAVALRSLVNFLRTTETDGNQLNKLFEVITKSKNDISMLFYMYCRIHNNFSSIEYYLDYRTFKSVNNKQKPWGFTAVVFTMMLITIFFSISHFVGIQNFIDMKFDIAKISLAFAFPMALLLTWLFLRIFILMKYQMYWVEFENLFRKVSTLCGDFFATQEDYYEEFSDNILSNLIPSGGIKRRIEYIIASTDPDDIDARVSYKPFNKKRKKEEKENFAAAVVPAAASGNNSNNNNNSSNNSIAEQKTPQMMPAMPGVRILKPHPETEAYLQAQAQITGQLMQMMMQQSMQQSQVMQRALSSQQALANSVVQQNIMAMRLEAQQTSLLRPDLAKRLSEQTYAWPTNRFLEKEAADAAKEADKAADIKTDIPDEKITVEESPAEVEILTDEPKPIETTPKAKEKDEKAIMCEKLQAALELLSPPPDDADKTPDPVFVVPQRDLTNVEQRLGQFFSARVYIYDKGEGV